MATCVRCGTPILWKRDGEGNPLDVDAHETTTGERLVERGGVMVAARASSAVLGFTAHRQTCPRGQR